MWRYSADCTSAFCAGSQGLFFRFLLVLKATREPLRLEGICSRRTAHARKPSIRSHHNFDTETIDMDRRIQQEAEPAFCP